MKTKRIFALLVVICLLASLSACGKKNKENAAKGVTAGGDFVIATAAAPDSLNPFAGDSKTARELFLLVYDPLWRMDENLQPQNCLVESYDVSSDGLTWTIRLRQDVSFSDGEPLTSADVKFSYELFAQYGIDSSLYYDGISSVKCPDDWTVIITTEYVKGNMMYSQTPILPEHIWSAYDNNPASMDNSAMIGSGPFIYQPVSLEPDEEQRVWTLYSREDYFAGAALLDSLSFRLYDSPTQASLALADGEADAAMDMTDVQMFGLADLQGVESFVVQGMTQGSCQLMMNTRAEALSNTAVREAVLYSIDWDSVYTMGFGSVGEQGEGFMPPNSPYYIAQERKYSFDLSKARAMLTAAGYSDADEDGVLEATDGQTELCLNLCSAADDAWATAAVSVITRELKNVGIETNWVSGSAEELAGRCVQDGNWDLYLVGVSGSCDPQVTAYRYLPSVSVTGWESEEYDGLYERMRCCREESEKIAILSEMQNCLINSAASAVVGYATEIQAIRADLWSGYSRTAQMQGGLFGTGCIDVYMQLHPYVEGENDGTEESSEETQTQTTEAYEPAVMATAVPADE